MLLGQKATLQANNLVERPLKKIQHIQEANLCLLRSNECLYVKITLPANFPGSDLTMKLAESVKCHSPRMNQGKSSMPLRNCGRKTTWWPDTGLQFHVL